MHFDDRLATVLAQTAAQGPLARIVYRQLVDILGRLSASARSPLVEESFARLEALSRTLPVAVRAQILAEPTMRLGNPRLVAVLLNSDPLVATAAVEAARLDEMEWLGLIPKLPIRARGILRHRRDLGPAVDAQLSRLGIDDRALPPASETVIEASSTPKAAPLLRPRPLEEVAPAISESVPSPVEPDGKDAGGSDTASPPSEDRPEERVDIGDIVRRIEAFRKARAESRSDAPMATAPRPVSEPDEPDNPLDLTPDDEVSESPPAGVDALDRLSVTAAEEADKSIPRPGSIDFATDGKGRIEWADAQYAPSLIGLTISGADADAPVSASPMLAAAFEHRQPLRDEVITILGAPAIAGRWHVDAVPRFNPDGGTFMGYVGRLRRRDANDAYDPTDPDFLHADSEDERMRQILHELRTPANAIQVASEVIQHALFGTVAQEYRAISAGIAGDAALVLAGFDELDRLVRLESGALAPKTGTCDLADLLDATIDRLGAWMEPRDCGFGLTGASRQLNVRIDREEGELLAWRLLASLAGHMTPGEWLGVACRADEGNVHVRIALPGALAGPDKEDLFAGAPFARTLFPEAPGDQAFAPGAGMFGIGFTLRLARAEASAVGGGLHRDENGLDLWLPEATESVRGRA